MMSSFFELPFGVSITVSKKIIEGMFDECDKFPSAETGGRLIGFYERTPTDLFISVKAVIAAGPKAKRTSVSFFQDGEYQEQVFRAAERKYPEIHHLGNWHSHHCNGLDVLSNGDCETYRKNVNSSHHATDFFYAILITRGTASERYGVKHWCFFRGNDVAYMVPSANVKVVEGGLLA